MQCEDITKIYIPEEVVWVIIIAAWFLYQEIQKIKEEKKLLYCQSRANAGIVFAAPDRAKRVDKITKACRDGHGKIVRIPNHV